MTRLGALFSSSGKRSGKGREAEELFFLVRLGFQTHVLVAFIDPTRKVAEDSRKNYGETRYNMLAKLDGRIFHITFTERGKIIWIISARKANKREQRRYEQG
jgi:uncharacterized DUF497 family protein